jgi:hypothetical protein
MTCSERLGIATDGLEKSRKPLVMCSRPLGTTVADARWMTHWPTAAEMGVGSGQCTKVSQRREVLLDKCHRCSLFSLELSTDMASCLSDMSSSVCNARASTLTTAADTGHCSWKTDDRILL